jgi:hypothetical protein
MAKVYEISARDLGRRFREVEQRRPEELRDAIRRAAAAGAEALAHVAPVGITGQFKSKLRAIPTEHGAVIQDDAPYAGIIELGARPHWAPVQPLYEWFKYKLGLDSKEGWHAAYAFQRKLAREGQRPTFFFRRRLGTLRRILVAEVEAALRGDGAGQ